MHTHYWIYMSGNGTGTVALFIAISGVSSTWTNYLRSNYETAQYPSGTSAPVSISTGNNPNRLESHRKTWMRIISVEDVIISVYGRIWYFDIFRERRKRPCENFLSAFERILQPINPTLNCFIDSFRWCEDLNFAMIERIHMNII